MINYLPKFNYLSIKLIRSRIRSGQELGQVICQNCHKSTTQVAWSWSWTPLSYLVLDPDVYWYKYLGHMTHIIETLACNHLYTDIVYVDITRSRQTIRTILFYVRLQKKTTMSRHVNANSKKKSF